MSIVSTRTLQIAIKLARLRLKFDALVHTLERRDWRTQPRMPSGEHGGEWTRVGGTSQSEERVRTALAGVRITERVGVGDDKLIRHCVYQDMFGRQFTEERDAATKCPETMKVPAYYGPF